MRPSRSDLARQLIAEGLGTLLLVAAVVGSGIMAERLTADTALALLANAAATAATLVVLISTLGPVSGAHFNPVVTLSGWLSGEMLPRRAGLYVAAQIGGAVLGTVLAHLMFAAPPLQLSQHGRSGAGQWLGELVATAGLVLVIRTGAVRRTEALPALVGLYVGAAYWFTSSTSFANPAVTLARALTDTFSGIAPGDVAAFIAAQLIGAALGLALARWLQPAKAEVR